MMPNSADNLPSEVTLPVPRAYRDYLVQKRIKSVARMALWVILIYAALGVALHWTTGSAMRHVIWVFFALVFGGRLSELLPQTWHYTLNAKEFRLMWWAGVNAKEWYWYTLKWHKHGVLHVEHDEWRGLPMLRLVTDDKTPNMVMVYAHEDVGTVQNVVLPLIESYRRQGRSPRSADALRQEKR